MVEMARMAEDCGLQAIALHPRTREQGYSGESGLDPDRGGERCGEDSGDRQRRYYYARRRRAHD